MSIFYITSIAGIYYYLICQCVHSNELGMFVCTTINSIWKQTTVSFLHQNHKTTNIETPNMADQQNISNILAALGECKVSLSKVFL